MRIARYSALCIAAILFCPALFSQKPAVSSVPSWIARTATDYNNTKVPGDVEDGRIAFLV